MASGEGIVNLQWEASPSEGVVGYRVYKRTTRSDWERHLDLGVQTEAEIRGLNEGSRFQFAVTALNAYGQESPRSPAATATVRQALTLGWTPGGDPTGLRYRLHIGSRSREYDRTIETTDTQLTVQGLRQGVTYFFAVSSLNDYGLESPLSPEARFNSAPPRAFDRDPGVFIFYSFR